jgi:hypothetical protein
MVKKKSKSIPNKAQASSSTTTSTPPAQPWEEFRHTLLLDFVREMSSLTNVFSMSDSHLNPSELAYVRAQATLGDKLLTPFNYSAYDYTLAPLADKLSMPLCVLHLSLSMVASCAKKAWSHDQGKKKSSIVTQSPPIPNQEVAPEVHDDNSQKQKPTTISSSSQAPITTKDDNAMIVDQHVNDQQPRNDNPWTLQTRKKVKRGTVTHKTMNNNNVSEQQKGQVRSLMIYDIPATWSHAMVLQYLAEWGQVLEVSFKKQHKYQSVWTKMVLKPLIDTNYVLRTWWQRLGNAYVRWYPGEMCLNDRKQREQFQAKLEVSGSHFDDEIVRSVWDNEKNMIDFFRAKSWKLYKSKGTDGSEKTTIILYFASQDTLLDALAKPGQYKLVRSITPPKKRKEPAPSSSSKDPKQVQKEKKKASSKKPTKPSHKGNEKQALIQALLKLLA